MAAVAVMLMGSAAAVEVSAESAVLLDAESGEILYEKAADERRLIASTTKIMTALLVLETCDPEDVVEIPKECEYVEGSSMYLREGERLTVRELLYGLLLLSGNDAGLALAIHAGGGDPARFVAEMNRFAAELGLWDTHFENPHGLDGEAHYATARDLARLAAFAMEQEDFREIVSTKEIRIAGRSMRNHNKLLWRMEEVCGVKTGFTKAAGRCLVSCAEAKGRRFVAVTLSAPDDWNDHEALYRSVLDRLSEERIVTAGETAAQIPTVYGGTETVVFSEDLSFWMTPEERENIEIRLFLPQLLYGGLRRGDLAGTAEIWVRGRLWSSVTLRYE